METLAVFPDMLEVPKEVELSRKEIDPVHPDGTDAVKVTGLPYVDGLLLELRVTDVLESVAVPLRAMTWVAPLALFSVLSLIIRDPLMDPMS